VGREEGVEGRERWGGGGGCGRTCVFLLANAFIYASRKILIGKYTTNLLTTALKIWEKGDKKSTKTDGGKIRQNKH
jgi:hypothetical protein